MSVRISRIKSPEQIKQIASSNHASTQRRGAVRIVSYQNDSVSQLSAGTERKFTEDTHVMLPISNVLKMSVINRNRLTTYQ